jgi:hypothetical protein
MPLNSPPNTNNVFAYDYAALDTAIATEAQAAATTIHALRAEMSDRENRIGHELIAIKKLLPHGQWLPWLAAEFTWTARQAQYYMRAARGTPRKCSAPAEDKHYWLTPPAMYERLDEEFHFDFDPCPHPRPEGFDGLTCEWGERNYVNCMFPDGYAFAKKALIEHQKGKLIAQVLPVFQMKAIAMLIAAGAERRDLGIPDWVSIRDGSISPKPMVDRQPCDLLILRPPHKETDQDEDEDDQQINRWMDETQGRPKEVGFWSGNRSGERHFVSGNPAVFYYKETGNTNCEWYTPGSIFAGLGVHFDLDPASPGWDAVPWIPVDRHLTLGDDGLVCSWEDLFIWLNPPYGRGRIELWTRKFTEHRNGIILVPERTSTVWYQSLAASADLILCLNKKIAFIGLDGKPKRQFPIGSHLIAIGERGVIGLENAYRARLGLLTKPYIP